MRLVQKVGRAVKRALETIVLMTYHCLTKHPKNQWHRPTIMNFAHESGHAGARKAALAKALACVHSQMVAETRITSKLLHSHIWLCGQSTGGWNISGPLAFTL